MHLRTNVNKRKNDERRVASESTQDLWKTILGKRPEGRSEKLSTGYGPFIPSIACSDYRQRACLITTRHIIEAII
jgi:hypothetical protein